LASSKKELESIKLDESTLSTDERERIQNIQKLAQESDELIKKAGFQVPDDDYDKELKDIEVSNTQWSGNIQVIVLAQT
jgi:hypothetical protein